MTLVRLPKQEYFACLDNLYSIQIYKELTEEQRWQESGEPYGHGDDVLEASAADRLSFGEDLEEDDVDYGASGDRCKGKFPS